MKYLMKGGVSINKREMFRHYLLEECQSAEDKYHDWLVASEKISVENGCSSELVTYYRKETEVAYLLWQYKIKCYNKQFKIKFDLEEN